jgi:hypothetical protein
MPTKFNLDIIRGTRYLKSFVYQDASKNPIDLTDLKARMQIREKVTSSTVELELSSDTGEIVLGGVAGTINIVIGGTATDTLTINNGIYDMEIFDPLDDDAVDTILEGQVTVREPVTRE